MDSIWLRRLSEFVAPTPDELAALDEARQGRREYRRNQSICLEGSPVREVHFILEGWVGGTLELNSGRTQLAKLYLPGDLAGLPSIPLARAAEGLVAITKVSLDLVPLDRLSRLFERAPRLALMLFVTSQQERVMLMDQLAAVGQLSAIQRVAALVVHVYRRLSVLSPEGGNVIDWPLSQQRIAQGAGLSAIHVNRTFRELVRRGLIAREGKRIEILDLEKLVELSGLPERPTVREPRWLASCCTTSAVQAGDAR